MRKLYKSFLVLSLLPAFAFATQSISEKKAEAAEREGGGSLEIDHQLESANAQLKRLRDELKTAYATVADLHSRGGDEEEFKHLLTSIQSIRLEIERIENSWKENAVSDAKKDEEGYALWDLEETTLSQLIMEYGAMDFLYVIPPEMASLKVNMHSSIPIPRESWSEVLEIILSQNGVGIKSVSPFVKQLYVLKQNLSSVQSIISKPEELNRVPAGARTFFLLSPPIEQSKNVFQFFERFADTKQTFIYQIGSKVAIVSGKEEVEKLLSLYNTVWEDRTGKISKVIPISKISAKEMQKVLSSFFGDNVEKTRTFFGKSQQDKLSIFPLEQGNSLVLVGSSELVNRAATVCEETERQLLDPAEMAIFTYTCRHSDPVELADILDKVYYSLLYTKSEDKSPSVEVEYVSKGEGNQTVDGYESPPPLSVSPPTAHRGVKTQLEIDRNSEHFIPDPKTGGLLMVIRRDTHPKIKDILRRLDVPKKMVQLEVLLFEKQLMKHDSLGMNLLKIGGSRSAVKFDGAFAPQGTGVLEFFLKGNRSKYSPAFDLAYSFLMAQDDIQLNAAPSVVTVNQTPATVSIVEELSINNGAAPIDSNKGVVFEKSYSRAQYGIKIKLTPTVHLSYEDDEMDENDGFITLQSDITFDTPKEGSNDRPLVDRRSIQNEARVPDGQTVILGGLRKKSTMQKRDKVPLLGDIPGIGKLFGSTKLTDSSTEMFIFITPKIILDPKEELEKIRIEQLKHRAGDLPEVLSRISESKQREKSRRVLEGVATLSRDI